MVMGQMIGEFNPAILQTGGVAELVNRQKCHVRFRLEPMKDPILSAKENRLVCRDVELIDVYIAGESQPNTFAVTDRHRAEYAEAYAKWKQGQTEQVVGTPLSALTWLTASRIAELKSLGIFTVENLSVVSDARIKALGMGAREEVRKANAFLTAAKDTGLVQRLSDENVTLKARLAEVEADLALAKQTISELRDGKEIKKERRQKKRLPLTEEVSNEQNK